MPTHNVKRSRTSAKRVTGQTLGPMKVATAKGRAAGNDGTGKISPNQEALDTRTLLARAAGEEFNRVGYYGTDTNRIARRAGFAPQTFYRHFNDKLDIFVAVYDHWRAEEAAALAAAIKSAPRQGASRAAAQTLVAHHRAWAIFRRSLRILAVDDHRVRATRAAGRRQQIAALAAMPSNARRSSDELFAAILMIERLCDAFADDEPANLGISEAVWMEHVRRAVADARGE
jgi:AcrR family transcriptional regulator